VSADNIDFSGFVLTLGFVFTIGMAFGGLITPSGAEKCDEGTFGVINETKTGNVSITNLGNDTSIKVVDSDGQNRSADFPNEASYSYGHEVNVYGYGCTGGENR